MPHRALSPPTVQHPPQRGSRDGYRRARSGLKNRAGPVVRRRHAVQARLHHLRARHVQTSGEADHRRSSVEIRLHLLVPQRKHVVHQAWRHVKKRVGKKP